MVNSAAATNFTIRPQDAGLRIGGDQFVQACVRASLLDPLVHRLATVRSRCRRTGAKLIASLLKIFLTLELNQAGDAVALASLALSEAGIPGRIVVVLIARAVHDTRKIVH